MGLWRRVNSPARALPRWFRRDGDQIRNVKKNGRRCGRPLLGGFAGCRAGWRDWEQRAAAIEQELQAVDEILRQAEA